MEDYVEEFRELSHLVDFNDVVLKDMFSHGLNKPIWSDNPTVSISLECLHVPTVM